MELGGHAAGAPPGARAAGHGLQLGGDGLHVVDQLRVRVGAGVGVVEAVDVAEQHQQLRPAQPGHDGGQGVVVAQHLGLAGLDLRRGHRVVLVDHRDHPQLQQGLKGVAQVLRPDGGLHVLPGEEDLGHGAVVLGKELVVDMYHHALAHGGGGLLHPQLAGPLLQPQLLGADADGARGYQHHLIAHALQIREHPGQLFHVLQVEAPGFPGQGGRAHLHHQPAGVLLFHLLHAPPWCPFHHTTAGRYNKVEIQTDGRETCRKENWLFQYFFTLLRLKSFRFWSTISSADQGVSGRRREVAQYCAV